MVGRLDPRDSFGLVVFDDQADVVVPTAALQTLGVDSVKAAIARISPGGCTDLSAGYLLGLSEASRAMSEGGATVILISDGHANSGETSATVLGDLAERRVPNPVVTVERLLQESQQSKREAISSLRAGQAEAAQDLLAGAITRLDCLSVMDPEGRAAVDEEVYELRHLSRLSGEGNTERTVKTSYASLNRASRSRPSRSRVTRPSRNSSPSDGDEVTTT